MNQSSIRRRARRRTFKHGLGLTLRRENTSFMSTLDVECVIAASAAGPNASMSAFDDDAISLSASQ